MNEVYCEIVGTAVGFIKTKVQVSVDFGQDKGLFERAGGDPLKDTHGKPIRTVPYLDRNLR